MKIFLLAIILFSTCLLAQAQTGIGTASPNASTRLEVSATDKVFLPLIALTPTNVGPPITSPA